MSESTSLTGLARLLLVAGLLSGCATLQAKSLALEESQAEQQKLHVQNAALSDDVMRLQNECDRLAEALEATTEELETREASSTAFPDLEAEGISVGWRGGDVVFTIPTAVTFGSGEASVSSEGQEALRTLARRLRSEFTGEARFHVEGHTDSDPIRNSGFESNRYLSIRRSMAVVEFLVQQCKIADERFVVSGYGPFRPLVPNDGAANKARNRRVELVVRQDR
jgi:chemotaxis protein MotB